VTRWPRSRLERSLTQERRLLLADLRTQAPTVEREGRKFKLLRLPDAFDQRPIEREIQFHRKVREVMRDDTFRKVS
jgi:hypothetical protein